LKSSDTGQREEMTLPTSESENDEEKTQAVTPSDEDRLSVEKEAPVEEDTAESVEIEADDDKGDGEKEEGVSVNDQQDVNEAEEAVNDDALASEEKPVPQYGASYEQVSSAQPPRFFPPSREQLLAWGPFWFFILIGALLRFWNLGDKPLHHDESLHAYFSLQLMHANFENWLGCFAPSAGCYHYDPLLHGPFQFHAIALAYKVSQLLGAPEHGVNTTTVRLVAALLGTALVGLPYFLRDYLGKTGALLACFLLAVSPSMVYFSRFAREDIYMAFFTLLLVVSVGRYVHTRKMGWLVTAAVAFSFSYATKEATFLTIAVFGSFFAALLIWDIGVKWSLREKLNNDIAITRFMPRTFAPVLLVFCALLAIPFILFFFSTLKWLSIFTTDAKTKDIADSFIVGLKGTTVAIVPWVGILLGVFVLFILTMEMAGRLPVAGRRGLARWVDPRRQPLLDVVVTIQWTHWFFALLCGWAVFLILFTALFTDIRGGIGDGIWQGLYYWLQQQQVARGGQPWYYYLLLIPLYEQIGLVFGLVGIVRCLLRPTRFRLFLVYWLFGNLFIYSWAAEKMPWLMIHMTMPLMLLAAVGLEPAVVKVVALVKGRFATKQSALAGQAAEKSNIAQPLQPEKRKWLPGGIAVASVVLAFLLVLPTGQNMLQVTYVNPSDGPHEMMVYVQTTRDVNKVMAKVDTLDRLLYGGRHELPIGLTDDATWPFAWYLRDYKNVCFQFPKGCQSSAQDIPVIIAGGDVLYSFQTQYSDRYAFKQYHMRTWWDEGYKPPAPPCDGVNCTPTWGGVGPLLWFSYGNNPPPNATFNPVLALKNIWQWWWERKAIGSTQGAYDMGLFIRKDLDVSP
jgi:uncharacterized protein (TIGR03663 family)